MHTLGEIFYVALVAGILYAVFFGSGKTKS